MIERAALVIDDNDDHRIWVASTLRDRGWDVLATRSGRLALDVAAQQRPRVVVTELILPDVQGLQLARALRLIIEQDVTIIAVTRLPHQLQQQALCNGYDHVLGKPIDALELFRAMMTPSPRVLLIDPVIAASAKPLA